MDCVPNVSSSSLLTEMQSKANQFSVWGITEGARKTSVNTEIIAFAVLDILATAVFGLWLLVSHRKIPETNVVLDGYWSHGLLAEGTIRLVGDDDA